MVTLLFLLVKYGTLVDAAAVLKVCVDMIRYELERLKPAASNLCGRISSLPVTSSKQRLAQSEIAKKVSTISCTLPVRPG